MKLQLILLTSFVFAISSCSKKEDQADAYGNFETDELTVSAESTGKLILFNAREGEELEAGEIVAMVDTIQLFLKKRQLESTIEAITKKLPNEAAQLAVFDEKINKLKIEVRRVESLVQGNAAPAKQLDDIKTELAVVIKQKEAAASGLSTQTLGMLAEKLPIQFQLRQMEDMLNKSYVRNPIKGTVLTTLVKQGEIAVQGRALYKIAPLDPLILRAYLSEDLLTSIKIGDKVSVMTDGPNGVLEESEGRITWISNEAEFTPKIIQTRDERTTQVYAIKVSVPNSGKLKIGMPAEVFIKKEL
jgi:HlyD family secretion protein